MVDADELFGDEKLDRFRNAPALVEPQHGVFEFLLAVPLEKRHILLADVSMALCNLVVVDSLALVGELGVVPKLKEGEEYRRTMIPIACLYLPGANDDESFILGMGNARRFHGGLLSWLHVQCYSEYHECAIGTHMI
jgi:hypothetical protein